MIAFWQSTLALLVYGITAWLAYEAGKHVVRKSIPGIERAAESRAYSAVLQLIDRLNTKSDSLLIPGRDDLAELDETPEPEPCRFCYAPATETGD